MGKKKQLPVTPPQDPMVIYHEVSKWKYRCGDLLEALRTIRDLDDTKYSLKIAKLTATAALKKFKE